MWLKIGEVSFYNRYFVYSYTVSILYSFNIITVQVFVSTLTGYTEVCRTQLYSFSLHRGETT